MQALAEKLKDARRESEVKVAGTKVSTALAKLKALREHQTTAKEAEHAVKQAVDAAQHIEAEEELRKRKEQEKAEAERGIRALIAGAISHLNKAEGTEAKLLLQKAEKLAQEQGNTISVDLGGQIAALIAAEKYKGAKGSTEWVHVCNDVKDRLTAVRVA